MRGYIVALVAMSLVLFAAYGSAAVVGTSHLRAPAVILFNNTGSLTNISLTITNGNGNVNITGPSEIGNSTIESASIAAAYAANFTGHNFKDYNFSYNIADAGENVSGPSAGAAMTILAVSAFENRPIRSNFTMTGTISSNGSIGEIGGVYDKVSAAKEAGVKIVLVPKVAPTDPEDELYLLVQTNFGIPLVQVANVSQAAHFALNGSISGIANETTYNFYKPYNTADLPNASINCSQSCNDSTFKLLLNSTFNLTRSEINRLNTNPKFANISAQLGDILNQSMIIGNDKYYYTAADFAFLDYVDAFYFNGYSTNRTSALSLLESVQSFCSSLTPPPLTTSNYGYVINAELRQAWGNYTINSVVTSYNLSQIDSDEILDELYLGAQSNGWCTAANLVYGESATLNGTYLAPSANLRNIASQRVAAAVQYGPTLYLTTAQQAYKESNYPVAILDADYAIALSSAPSQYNTTVSQLNAMSLRNAHNATYGVWATQFANEAAFYVNESNLTTNSSLSKTYAESGYAASLLAYLLSNDTKTIRSNLVVSQTPYIPPVVNTTSQGAESPAMASYIALSQGMIIALLVVIVVLLLINTALIAIILSRFKKANQPKRLNQQRRNRK